LLSDDVVDVFRRRVALQSTINLIADNSEGVSLHLDVMREIRHQLLPYQVGDRPITGGTVISDGSTIDSLTLMDMIMALEDRFDVSLPLNIIAEIRTVDQLADTILTLCGRA
jgi:acyl carrier protein